MKNLLKRNQVIITALAIMIAVAGYLNFTSDRPVLETGVENLESEGASGNDDDGEISVALDDTVSDTDVTTVDATAAEDGEAVLSEEDYDENASLDENGEPIDGEKVGETVLTNASVTLSQAKLNREQTRSKAKDILLEIINNDTLDEASKQDAINEMIAMTKRMEQETAAETQLAAKGFADSIVTISDDCVDVTLNITNLNDVQRTQIEDIITRKTGYELNKIVITTTGK
ncbi:MAG: SpoIIIAH-like family protein [Lachnospiraceae bacterium]